MLETWLRILNVTIKIFNILSFAMIRNNNSYGRYNIPSFIVPMLQHSHGWLFLYVIRDLQVSMSLYSNYVIYIIIICAWFYLLVYFLLITFYYYIVLHWYMLQCDIIIYNTRIIYVYSIYIIHPALCKRETKKIQGDVVALHVQRLPCTYFTKNVFFWFSHKYNIYCKQNFYSQIVFKTFFVH